MAFTASASVDLAASGDAETLLGPDLTIPAGKTLRLDGGQGWTGWDGTGTATLKINGTLDMRSTPIFATNSNSRRFGVCLPLEGQESGFEGIADYHTHPTASTTVGQHLAVRELTALPIIGEQIMSSVPTSSNAGDDSENDMPIVIETSIPRANAVYVATVPKIAPLQAGRFGLTDPTVSPDLVLNCELHLDLLGVPAGVYPLTEASTTIGTFSAQQIVSVGAGLTASVTEVSTAMTLTVVAI